MKKTAWMLGSMAGSMVTSMVGVAAAGAVGTADNGVALALGAGQLGLQPASAYRLSNGKCTDCSAPAQALWYFQNETLAVPRAGDIASTPLVWLASPSVIDNATLLPSGDRVRAGATDMPFRITPKIATNRSYWNAATTGFFVRRELRLRGASAPDGSFVARTVWPKDYTMSASGPVQPVARAGGLAAFVRAAGGGAAAPYSTRLIWERHPGQRRDWTHQPVLGLMLNGAQGDDDEAFGGHFGVTTGQVGAQGSWSDWIVNNFYNLDSFSEKGIIAAPVPMDNYLMDLNSGQQYYRPSYMLVAVLNNPRAAQAYQASMQQVFTRFYKHQLPYQHSASNCAGISMDVFRALGWQIPTLGATSTVKALGAYAYVAAKDGSLAGGRKIYDYLTEEQTRLYPAVAFEAAGNDLLDLLGAGQPTTRALTAFERQLQSDVEALVLVRIPQVPSSRALGSAPVFSFDEYRQRTPADQKDWKIVPVAPRPFPVALREAGAEPPAAPSPVPLPIAGIGAGGLLGAGAFWRRRRRVR